MSNQNYERAQRYIAQEEEAVERASLQAKIATAVASERERCAKIAETPYSDAVKASGQDEPMAVGTKIAAAIRK